MANPKRRHSKARRDHKRAHKGLKLAQLVSCSKCGTRIRPHHICASCGYYRGRQMIVGKTA